MNTRFLIAGVAGAVAIVGVAALALRSGPSDESTGYAATSEVTVYKSPA